MFFSVILFALIMAKAVTHLCLIGSAPFQLYLNALLTVWCCVSSLVSVCGSGPDTADLRYSRNQLPILNTRVLESFSLFVRNCIHTFSRAGLS